MLAQRRNSTGPVKRRHRCLQGREHIVSDRLFSYHNTVFLQDKLTGSLLSIGSSKTLLTR